MRLLVSIALAWMSGILVESVIGGGTGVWLAAGVGTACLAILQAGRRSAWPRAGWLVGAVAVACGAAASAGQRARQAAEPPWPVAGESIFEGELARPIEEIRPGVRQAVIDVTGIVAGGTWVPAGGRVLVSEESAGLPLLAGDRVRVRAVVRAPRGYWDEGAVDEERLYAGRDIDWLATARPPGITRIDAAPEWSLWRLAAGARGRAARVLSGGGGDGAGLLRALVLGERGRVPAAWEDAFRRAGVSHVLSVSGLHLAAIALIFFEGVRRAWLRSVWLAIRFPADRAAALLALPAVAGYTMVTGAEVATVRSALCMAVFLAGRALGRRPDALSALAAAGLAILVDSPWALFEASFQLSFAATAALALLAERQRRGEPPASLVRRLLRAAGRLVLASAVAGVATAPLTALHFGVVQPAGLVTNLVVVPLAELVILPLGLLGTLVGSVWAEAGAPIVWLAARAAGLLGALVRAIASVSPVVEVPPPRPLELLALGLAGWAALRLRPRRAVLVAGLACAVAAGSYVVSTRAARSGLTVTFLDVGQGDSAVIEAPGETWLVDAGGRLFGDADQPGADPGEQAVWRFLRERRIRRLDVVVLSHPHPDHYGGLAALAGHLPIGEVWLSGEEVDDARWREVRRRLAGSGARLVTVAAGSVRERAGVRLSALGPVGGADPERSVNDNSLVARVDFAGRSLLFAGDLEAAGEEALVASTPAGLLRADVVKVPHHGSRTSSSPALVAATSPSLAVVSCGLGNRFHFPAPSVVAAWAHAGARVMRTDLEGEIVVHLEPDGALSVDTFAARRARRHSERR